MISSFLIPQENAIFSFLFLSIGISERPTITSGVRPVCCIVFTAYWVGFVNVKNQEEYKKYTDIAGPAIIASGAKILSRGGKIVNLEGQKYGRIVIIEFPSVDHAEKFYISNEYREALQYVTDEVADRLLNVAEGLD